MSSPAIALNPERLEEIRIKRRKEKCMESNQETIYSTPKIRLSLLHWMQILAIVIPSGYFIFQHITADEVSRTVITSKQQDMTRHLETLDIKVDSLGTQISKIDGKIDVILLGLKK